MTYFVQLRAFGAQKIRARWAYDLFAAHNAGEIPYSPKVARAAREILKVERRIGGAY